MNEPQNQGDWQELVTDVDAFYNEETQPQIRGKVVSITIMDLANRETEVAVILLTAPAKAVKGKGKEKETVLLEPGQSIGVVVKHKLKDLYSFVQNQNEVEITAKEKITLENANTMWRYGIKFRGRRVLSAAPGTKRADRPAADAGSASEDMPGF